MVYGGGGPNTHGKVMKRIGAVGSTLNNKIRSGDGATGSLGHVLAMQCKACGLLAQSGGSEAVMHGLLGVTESYVSLIRKIMS